MTRRQRQITWSIGLVAICLYAGISAWGLGCVLFPLLLAALWAEEAGRWLGR